MKNRNPYVLSLGLVAAGLFLGVASAQPANLPQPNTPKPKAEAPKLPTCPVTGEPIDFAFHTMTDRGPVYFCCEGCIKRYQKKPEKYADKVAAQQAALAKLPRVQVNCPISGKPIDKQVFTEKGGQKVYFCCPNCKAKYEDDPGAYAAKLAASYTYQTRCPVMGGEINPQAYLDLPTGQRIYFCCKGCDDKFLAHPEKFAPKLAQQGIHLDLKALKATKSKGEHERHGRGHEGHDHP